MQDYSEQQVFKEWNSDKKWLAWMDQSQFIVLFDSGINNKDYKESNKVCLK